MSPRWGLKTSQRCVSFPGADAARLTEFRPWRGCRAGLVFSPQRTGWPGQHLPQSTRSSRRSRSTDFGEFSRAEGGRRKQRAFPLSILLHPRSSIFLPPGCAPVDFFWTSERSLSSAPSGRQNVAERGQPSVEDRKSGSSSPGATFRADFGTGRASGTRTHVKSTVNGVERHPASFGRSHWRTSRQWHPAWQPRFMPVRHFNRRGSAASIWQTPAPPCRVAR